MDLDWEEMLDNKVTMLNHNFHFFPPILNQKDDKGLSVLEWKDEIREKVGWDVLQSASDFFIVDKIECLDNYREGIDDWPLIDPRKINCLGRKYQV